MDCRYCGDFSFIVSAQLAQDDEKVMAMTSFYYIIWVSNVVQLFV